MINYAEDWLYKVLFQRRGSVSLQATCFALPAAAIALLLRISEDELERFMEMIGVSDIQASQTWTASTAVLAIMLSFRTTQALSRFWEGTSLLHQMRGEWFDSVSCCVTFTRGSLETKAKEVWVFRHAIVRLMSLCHGSALEEIADTDNLLPIDVHGLDKGTLRHLKECKKEHEFNRVEVILQLVKTLITKSLDDQLLKIAPPILSRVYQTLSRGYVNLLNAKKIKDTKFPFPYAQLIVLLLCLHLVLTPVMIAVLIKSKLFVVVLTFVPIFGMFSLNFIAVQLENPFGNDDNDLPLERFQLEMNRSLLMLLHRNTDHVAYPSKVCIRDFQDLRDGVSTRLRRHSISSMGGLSELSSTEPQEFVETGLDCLPKAPRPSLKPISVDELTAKMALVAKRVEAFGLSLPHWTQMIETQVLELGRSFSVLQDLTGSNKSKWQGELNDAAAASLQQFPAL